MKRYLVLVLLLTTAALAQQTPQPTTPTASEPATRADILRLFRAMDVQQQMRPVLDQVMAQSRAMSRQAIKERHPDVSEADLDRMDKVTAEVAKNFPVEDLMQDMIPVYQRHLTKADVRAMIVFYSSPTGKKLLREMPAISAEGMQAVYPRLQKTIDESLSRAEAQFDQQKSPASAPKQSGDK